MQDIALDTYDFKLLEALAKNGRLTNQDLSERINLSPSQCSRRRMALEEAGIIRGYKADISREKLGNSLVCFTFLTLNKHSGGTSRALKDLVLKHKEIEEAHALTGNYDYLLKIAVRDLKSLSQFINSALLSQEIVTQLHSSICLESLKEK
jgi:DNA-binding Lrp family transcriptional regulator